MQNPRQNRTLSWWITARTGFQGSLRNNGRLRVSRCWFKDSGTAFPKEIPHAPIISAAGGCGFLAGRHGAQYPNILPNEISFSAVSPSHQLAEEPPSKS